MSEAKPRPNRSSTRPKHDPEAVATGVGMIAAGNATRYVASIVGIPRTTLIDAYQRTLGPDAPTKDEARKVADERLLATAYCAAEQLLGRMAAEAEDVDHRTATAWTDVALRAIGRLRGWDRGIAGESTVDRFATAVERIVAGGASITVSIAQPGDLGASPPVIDVTPSGGFE